MFRVRPKAIFESVRRKAVFNNVFSAWGGRCGASEDGMFIILGVFERLGDVILTIWGHMWTCLVSKRHLGGVNFRAGDVAVEDGVAVVVAIDAGGCFLAAEVVVGKGDGVGEVVGVEAGGGEGSGEQAMVRLRASREQMATGIEWLPEVDGC